MDEYRKFRRDVEKLTADERRAVTGLLKGVVALTEKKARVRLVRAVADVAAASARTAGRRASDRETDVARRVTVSARMLREDAERYRRCALDSGRSLYRFILDAMQAEYLKTTGGGF